MVGRGGGGGGPEPCVCVERGGAWGGGRSGVWEFVAPSNYLCVCLLFIYLLFLFFIFFGGGVKRQSSRIFALLGRKSKYRPPPPPPPQPTRCGWWGVLGAGMECVGNGGGVLCCGGGGCKAVPVCMCAWLKAALHDLQVSMTPLNVKLGPLAGDRKKGERGQICRHFHKFPCEQALVVRCYHWICVQTILIKHKRNWNASEKGTSQTGRIPAENIFNSNVSIIMQRMLLKPPIFTCQLLSMICTWKVNIWNIMQLCKHFDSLKYQQSKNIYIYSQATLTNIHGSE